MSRAQILLAVPCAPGVRAQICRGRRQQRPGRDLRATLRVHCTLQDGQLCAQEDGAGGSTPAPAPGSETATACGTQCLLLVCYVWMLLTRVYTPVQMKHLEHDSRGFQCKLHRARGEYVRTGITFRYLKAGYLPKLLKCGKDVCERSDNQHVL